MKRVCWIVGLWMGSSLLPVGLVPVAGQAGAHDFPRKITFTVFGEPGGDWSDIWFSGDGERFEPVRFNPYGRSEAFVAMVGRGIHFYRRHQPLDAAADPAYSPIGYVSLTAEVSKFLFLFVLQPAHPESRGSEIVSIFALNDGSRAIPVDHLTLFNATGRPLQGSINRSPVRVGIGQNNPMKVDPGDTVALELSVLHETVLHPVLINRIRVSSSRRTVLLLLPPRSPGALRIRAFRISEAVVEGGTSMD